MLWDVAYQGDNDPVDVVELGGRALAAGSVHRVRALGAYAMIDEGELGARPSSPQGPLTRLDRHLALCNL